MRTTTLTEMKYKAVLDRGFSYVKEDRPTEEGECCPTIIARDLLPEHAQIFAASFDLLEACQSALDGLYSYDNVEDNCSARTERDKLRAAIAKAKGQP